MHVGWDGKTPYAAWLKINDPERHKRICAALRIEAMKIACSGKKRGELEITPQMIEAGVSFLRDSGRLAFEAEGPDQALVVEFLGTVLRAGKIAD